jgi:hypothetical protein
MRSTATAVANYLQQMATKWDFVNESANELQDACSTTAALGPDVVDQARFPDPRSYQQTDRALLGAAHGFERFGVARLEMVEHETSRLDLLASLGDGGRDGPALA